MGRWVVKLPTRLDRELLFRPSKITTRRDGRHSRDATGEFQCSVLVRHFSSYAAANEAADPDIARGGAAVPAAAAAATATAAMTDCTMGSVVGIKRECSTTTRQRNCVING